MEKDTPHKSLYKKLIKNNDDLLKKLKETEFNLSCQYIKSLNLFLKGELMNTSTSRNAIIRIVIIRTKKQIGKKL